MYVAFNKKGENTKDRFKKEFGRVANKLGNAYHETIMGDLSG